MVISKQTNQFVGSSAAGALSQGSTAPSDPPGAETERERDIHYVHSASLAAEDGVMFMSEPSAARQ